MKIGFVLDDGLDAPDGVQQYVLTVGTWLVGQGHEVHYIVGQTKRNITNTHSLARNIKVKFNQNVLTIPLGVQKKKIHDLLDREKFDVLHVQMPFSPQFVGRVIRAAPPVTAVVGTFHILPASRLVHIGTSLLKYLTLAPLRRLDAVISVSEPAQHFLQATFGITSQVIPNAIDLSKFHAPQQKHIGKKIVFLGRLVERKGARYLLQAFAAIKKAIDVNLVIGGTGPLENDLRKMAGNLGIANRVSFEGFVDESAKASFLSQGDIVAFPSTGGESFGIVLLEAMAAGAGVVLGGNNPGYASVLQNNPKVLVNPKDTDAFAGCLQKLLDDTDLREQLQTWQKQLVKNYDIKVVGPQIMVVYQMALKR